MKISHILVAGVDEGNFHGRMPEGIHFRFVPTDEITDTDLHWADVYVGSRPCAGFHFSRIKWVHSFNAGVNNFLEVKGWQEKGVLLTRTICTFGQRISEYCLSYVLQDLQFHQHFTKSQEQREWSRRTPRMVKNETVVVYGTGEIGQEVARTFRFFGATVYGVSYSGEQKSFFEKVVTGEEAGPFLEKADWLISTLPLTKETEGMFNRELFQHVNGAAFINVGRGGTVEEEALLEALDSVKLRRGILDVFATEPLTKESKLWEREDITITPHISAVTEMDEAIECFFKTLSRVQNQEEIGNRVDITKGY